jgi:hypothetical protein
MIFFYFCMLPAQLYYMIVYIQKVESCVQIADRCAPWKISSGAQELGIGIERVGCTDSLDTDSAWTS